MGSRPFSNADPFLQLIVLFLLAFFCVGLFLLMGQGLLNALWGVSLFENPTLISDYENEQVIRMNRLLLFFQHLGLFVVPAIIFAALCSTNWKKYLGFRFILPQFAVGSIIMIIAALPLINVLAWANQSIVFPEFLAGVEKTLLGLEESAALLTEAIAGSPDINVFLVNIVVLALLPAFGEEMIFRGVVLPILRKWTGNVHLAVWISAFIFSAFHLQFYGFLPRFILGALLGYLFVWSKSLWAPIIAHFINNTLALFLMLLLAREYIPEEVDQFNATWLDWLLVLASIAIIVVGIFFLTKYSKGWRNNRLANRLQQETEPHHREVRDIE